jgi:hypothetical protein
MSTEANREPFLDRQAIPEFLLKEFGLRVPRSTLAKLSALGRGPQPAKFYGRRCLYERNAIRAWARSLMTDAPSRIDTAGEPERPDAA